VQINYFDVYLYACLVESAPFIREDDRLGQWTQTYNARLEDVRRDNAEKLYNASPLRQKHPGIVA
jgi:hypothetical protein